MSTIPPPNPAVIERDGVELASTAFTAWLFDVDESILLAEFDYQRTKPAAEGVFESFTLPAEWTASGQAKMQRLGITTSAQAEALFLQGVER